MQLTVSCAEKLNTGHNFRHDTVFLRELSVASRRSCKCARTSCLQHRVFHCTLRVIVFLLRTWKSSSTLRKEFVCFSHFTRAVPSFLDVQFSIFIRHCDYPLSVKLAHFLCSVSPGWCEGFHLHLRWQRLSDVKYRHPGRIAGPFVAIIDNIVTELDITLSLPLNSLTCLLIDS